MTPAGWEEARAGALSLHRAGRLAEAERRYRELLAARPGDGETWHFLSVLKGQEGQHEEAARCCQRALDSGFCSPSVYFNLASALAAAGDSPACLDAAEKGLAVCTDDVELGIDLASIIIQSGCPRRGLAGLRVLERRFPGNYQVIEAIADCAIQLSLPEEGHAALAAMISLDAANHVPHLNLANLYFMQGMPDEAERSLVAVWRRAPGLSAAYLLLTHLRKVSPAEPRGAELLARAESESGRSSADLQFAAGRVFEGDGQLDRAFQCFDRGNRLIRDGVRYDEDHELRRMAELRALSATRPLPASSTAICNFDANILPLFIVGMPRSGSTLLETLLARHPEISSAGELVWLQRLVRKALKRSGRAFPEGMWQLDEQELRGIRAEYLAILSEFARTGDAVRFCIDKLPANVLYVPLIARLFPESPIIGMRREGLATCLSCYRHLFASPQRFAYDMAETARYWVALQALQQSYENAGIARWYPARYEGIIQNPRREISMILEHCGLDAVDSCFLPTPQGDIVRTASAVQVRSPFARSFSLDAGGYLPFVRPILEILESVRSDSLP